MADWLLEELYASRGGYFLTTTTVPEANIGDFNGLLQRSSICPAHPLRASCLNADVEAKDQTSSSAGLCNTRFSAGLRADYRAPPLRKRFVFGLHYFCPLSLVEDNVLRLSLCSVAV